MRQLEFGKDRRRYRGGRTTLDTPHDFPGDTESFAHGCRVERAA